jgi:hypothetical protein
MADPSRSERLRLLSRIGLIVVAVAMVLTLLGGWIASTQVVAEIDQSKFQNYQKGLQSYAAEALLLAKQYKDQRSTANYTEVSLRKLFEATSDIANKLQEEQPAPDLAKAVDKTANEASDLADVLAKLAQLPDQSQMNDLISQLKDVSRQLQEQSQ